MPNPLDPVVIPFGPPHTPNPIRWFVSSIACGPMPATAITRVWGLGDTRTCRLCPRCHADHDLGVCQVLVNCYVPADLAPTFSTHGLFLVRTSDLRNRGQQVRLMASEVGQEGDESQ